MQFLRGDRLWSPLCALCRFCLFLELCDFLFLLFYHFGKLRFAFFSCLCVYIEFLSAAVGESWEVASFSQCVVYLIHASCAALAYLRLVRLEIFLNFVCRLDSLGEVISLFGVATAAPTVITRLMKMPKALRSPRTPHARRAMPPISTNS